MIKQRLRIGLYRILSAFYMIYVKRSSSHSKLTPAGADLGCGGT